MNVTDKVIVVTGAAGELGRVTARRLAEAGAKLALVERNTEHLHDTCASLEAEYGALLVGGVDVTDPGAVQHMVDTVVGHWGRIDGLLNIAGGYKAGPPLHETPLDAWDFIHNLNAKSVFLVSAAVIPHLIAGGRGGAIVSIAAMPALKAPAGHAAYAASKSAIIRMTESMAAELREHRINVNCVAPSTLDTPRARAEQPNADYSRWTTLEALAAVLVFLLSEEARAINGVVIPITSYG